MAKKRTKRAAPEIPAVGSKVRMRFGTVDVVATVTEHRGPLGVGGRELLRVRFFFTDTDDPVETEVPIDEVTLVESAA
jgi:hypothetical protein